MDSLHVRLFEPSGQRDVTLPAGVVYLAWTDTWEPRPSATNDVVLELTPAQGGLVLSRARPEVQLNGQPWTGPVPVRPGDRIRYGGGGVEIRGLGSTVVGSQTQSDSRLQPSLGSGGSGGSGGSSGSSGSAGAGGRVSAPPLGSMVGRYRLDDTLGQGQFGAVYRAYDTQLGREVALKLLVRPTERARKRFLRELKATANLDHPHLVTTYDGGETEGWLYLAMQIVTGRTLHEAARDPSATREDKVRWIAQCCRAVGYANGLGVLHRDLKPSNVMVDAQNLAYVVDFGLAGMETEESERLTATGAALGTPAYMAAEVIYRGGQEASARSEVFALAASLYNLLTGRSPRQELRKEPEPIRSIAPDLPEWLLLAIETGMREEPDGRFQSADELADALEAGLAGAAATGGGGKGPLLAAAALVLVLVLAGAAAAVLTGGAPSPTQRRSGPAETPGGSGDETPPPAASASPTASASAQEDPPLDLPAQLERALARLETSRAEGHPWQRVLPLTKQLRVLAGEVPEREAEVTRALLALHVARGQSEGLVELLAGYEEEGLLLARALRLLGHEQRAQTLLTKLAGESPETATQRAAAAQRDLWLGNASVARTWLPEADAVRGSDPAATLELARVAAHALAALGEQAPARAWLERLSASPDDLELAFLRADLAPDPRAALEPLETCAALQAPTPATARRVAAFCLRAGAPAKGARWLERVPALKLLPTDHVLLGRLREAKREDGSAAFRAGFEADPILFWRATRGLSERERERAWSAANLRPPQGALSFGDSLPDALAQELASASPAAKAALEAAVLAGYRGAPWPELAPQVEVLIKAAGEDALAWTWAVRLLVGRDRFEAALKTLSDARQAAGAGPAFEQLEAELWLRRGRVDTARQRYKAAAQAETLAGRVAKAELGWLQGQADSGAEGAAALVAEHPAVASAWLALAVNQINQQKPTDALRSLERAIELEGGINVRPLMFRALLLARSAETKLERYAAFEQTFTLGDGASPRLLAASVALTRNECVSWIEAELARASAHEPERAELPLWIGVAGITRRAPRREVDALWRRAEALQPGLRLPPTLSKAYQERFGEAYRR